MSQQVALVTGSTSGIGLACAHMLGKRGINVVVTGSRDKSLVESQLTDLKKHGVLVDYVQADLSKSADVDMLWSEVSHRHPQGVDILINNAGINRRLPVDEFPVNEWEEMVALNLTAPFKLTKRCIPGMKRKGWGRIVNISSTAGLISSAKNSLYSATKHGLIGLTKGVALENADCGITCNAVCPALTDTPMLADGLSKDGKKLGLSPAEYLEKWLSTIPIPKLITSEQVAELVEYLCFSDASSQTTGASYLIDSGHVAR